MVIKKIHLAHLPTPLQRLSRLSTEWNGEIWIKRDDLTGMELTGNKVRKLEYLLAEAADHNADTIITCGGVQSNHCRATALACAQLGFRCLLLLRGHSSRELDGNLLLDRLSGAEIEFISEDEYYENLHGHLSELAEEVINQGGKPYIIIEGGSDTTGAWGYVEAMQETQRQCQLARFEPDRIVIATGSGGTHAGMLVGTKLLKWNVDIVSMSVCYDAAETTRRIFELIEAMIDRHCLDLDIKSTEIKVIEKYRGSGYAKAGAEEYKIIVEVARIAGLLVDPVYTGKAIRGVKEEYAQKNFSGSTLFWHTGGAYALFPFRGGFNSFLK